MLPLRCLKGSLQGGVSEILLSTRATVCIVPACWRLDRLCLAPKFFMEAQIVNADGTGTLPGREQGCKKLFIGVENRSLFVIECLRIQPGRADLVSEDMRSPQMLVHKMALNDAN